MPTLRLRVVGMSYAIEGASEAGLDAEALFEALQSRHGLAVAAIGTPAETVLIDHKAESREGIETWLEIWVGAQGATNVAWERADSLWGELAADTLRFDL